MYMLWFVSCTVPHTILKNFLHTLSEMNALDTNWILMKKNKNLGMKYLIFTYWKSKKLQSWHTCTGQLKMSLCLWKMLQNPKTTESNTSLYRLCQGLWFLYGCFTVAYAVLVLFIVFYLKVKNQQMNSINLPACHLSLRNTCNIFSVFINPLRFNWNRQSST